MGGIVRELQGKAVTINGTADHVHLLLWMPAMLSISEALRVVKTNSSRWVNRQHAARHPFAWQTGYGAFSVSHSNAQPLPDTFTLKKNTTRRSLSRKSSLRS